MSMVDDVIVVSSDDAIAMAFPYGASGKSSGSSASAGNPIPFKEEDINTAKFTLWGTDNMWPKHAWNSINENSLAPIAVGMKADTLVSGGLVYGAVYIKDGEEVFEQVLHDDIDKFIDDSCLNTMYLPIAGHSISAYQTFFPKLIFNRESVRKISELYCDDPHFCRMGKQEGKYNHITKVYTSGKFNDGDLNPKDLKPVNAVDRHGNILKQIQKANSSHIYYPIFKRINGNVAYEFPRWEGVRNSKWLDLAKHIPIWKAALMTNQASVKYQFIIHPDYWKRQKGWGDLSPEQKAELQKKIVKAVLDSITGSDKAGKAHFTETVYDEESRTRVPLFEIKRLDTGKAAGGDYIEDSQEADAHITRAFQVPMTLIGNSGKGGIGAGSGSDARVHGNQWALRMKSEQDAIVEPIKTIARVNDWKSKIEKVIKGNKEKGYVRFECRLKNYHIATLSSGQEVLASDKANANGDKKTQDNGTTGN